MDKGEAKVQVLERRKTEMEDEIQKFKYWMEEMKKNMETQSVGESFFPLLAKSNPQERKQLIGERLFLRINSIIGDGQRSINIVSKLLLDDNEELLIMCFDMNYLKKAINCISDPNTKELRNPRK